MVDSIDSRGREQALSDSDRRIGLNQVPRKPRSHPWRSRRVAAVLMAATSAFVLAVLTTPPYEPGFAQSRTQAVLDPAAWGDDHVDKPLPSFVGGDECLFCHRGSIGASWQKNGHFLAVRDKFREINLAREIEMLAGQRRFRRLAGDVDFVMGGRHAVRFLRRGESGSFDLLSVAMNPSKERPRWVVHGKPEWDTRRFQERCIGCHMSGVDPKTLKPFETFVGCESCHGPFDEQHTNGSVLMKLAPKAHDDARVVASICGQCHLRGGASRSTGRPFANGFVAGDNLFRDFSFDFERVDKLNPIDAHIQRNIRDIAILGRTGLTCVSCHRIHSGGTESHRRRAKSEYCLTCHIEEDYKRLVPFVMRSPVCEY